VNWWRKRKKGKSQKRIPRRCSRLGKKERRVKRRGGKKWQERKDDAVSHTRHLIVSNSIYSGKKGKGSSRRAHRVKKRPKQKKKVRSVDRLSKQGGAAMGEKRN